MDLDNYRNTETEQNRIADLIRLLPKGRQSILEIGARDGYHTRRLTSCFASVTALDLERPSFTIERVTTVGGDVTALNFPDNSFDCVLCAEVLEHVRPIERAAAEITRVARGDVLIGVPYRQDIRVGKLTCDRCGFVNPPYGHVNTFDERRLQTLFADLTPVETSLMGSSTDRTNLISSALMTIAGNPWGTYEQDEPCIHCGSRMKAPTSRTAVGRVASRLATSIDNAQRIFLRPTACWIHVLFRK